MNTVADSGVGFPKKKSLLDKLSVPVHHLDFEFVKKCTDVRDLEKIIKILRSKQEGHYPELEACAENQLAALDRGHRLLRRSTKVMTKADLSKEEWNNITSDLLNWKGGVDNQDLEIFEAKSRAPNGTLPNIRNSSKGFRNAEPSGTQGEKSHRISSLDYKSWEKFDVDEECKKMDLEEEQRQSVENRKNSGAVHSEKISASIEELALESLGNISHLSSNEREVMAIREKDVGNEFYNTNKVEDAIKHYTRSIHLSPTVAGLNNRAAAYLRQCAFNKALDDLNQVLEMDPKNVKARFRRAQSFQHKNMFREALEDINEVLIKEPTHLVARHIADQLRESLSKLPKMHKIKIKDKETGKTVIKTITEEEMLNDYKNENFIEVNGWGFPKIMCNCNGKHSNDPAIRHEDHMRYQHLNRTHQKKFEKVDTTIPEKYAPIALPGQKPSQGAKILEMETTSLETEKLPSLPGKKLDILEVEKGSQETECGRKDIDNSCVVADMRSAKSPAIPDLSEVEILSDGNVAKSDHPEKTREVAEIQQTELITNQRSSNTDSSLTSNHPGKSDKSRSPPHKSTKIKTEKHGTRDVSPKIENEKFHKKRDKSPKNNDQSSKIGNGKSQKTNKNSIIKDISSNDQSSRMSLDPESLIPDRVKGVKTDKNSRIQVNRMVNGHVDNKMESAARQPCGCSEVFNKFQFKKEWSVLTGPKSLEQKAKLLKSICPKHLVKAFGNSWEKEMLVDVFECLSHHFSPTEQQWVAEYLTAVPRLDRFKINAMFLTTEEKSLARELVKNCSAHLDSSTMSAFSS